MTFWLEILIENLGKLCSELLEEVEDKPCESFAHGAEKGDCVIVATISAVALIVIEWDGLGVSPSPQHPSIVRPDCYRVGWSWRLALTPA
ncbi:hypothetical protein ElyMa_001130700 [Elysia marginata]|uniref:Uncharacterized protein n=1 Tax=Elysia marginata TaxID=1093978 RepID=A0AAV4HZE5_9GAST|nr:hypothetical protein ElyMa_001130700 [Elysia marginata]